MNIDEYYEVGAYLEDNGFSHSDIDDYFEHHGVKGMHWGSRAARATGRGLVRGTKAVGRGVAATGKFAWDHKKGTAAVVIGIATTALILSHKGKTRISEINVVRPDMHNLPSRRDFNKQILDRHKDVKLSDISRSMDAANSLNIPFSYKTSPDGPSLTRLPKQTIREARKYKKAHPGVPTPNQINKLLDESTRKIIEDTNRMLGI